MWSYVHKLRSGFENVEIITPKEVVQDKCNWIILFWHKIEMKIWTVLKLNSENIFYKGLI